MEQDTQEAFDMRRKAMKGRGLAQSHHEGHGKAANC